MFKMIRYGMSNWRDKEVRQGQVDLETSFTKDDKKEALVGSFGGRLYLVYRERPERMRDSVVWFEVLDLLAELTAQVQLDVEFVIHTSDVPMVEKSADKVCGHKDRFVFSVSGGPLFCDVALGPGVRGTSLLRAGDDLRKSDIPYEQKINLGFWRGAPWPARRCGSWKRSPRILMPKASLQHPDVLNASLSTLDCGDKEPQDLCREVKTLKAQRVSWLEQLRPQVSLLADIGSEVYVHGARLPVCGFQLRGGHVLQWSAWREPSDLCSPAGQRACQARARKGLRGRDTKHASFLERARSSTSSCTVCLRLGYEQ